MTQTVNDRDAEQLRQNLAYLFKKYGAQHTLVKLAELDVKMDDLINSGAFDGERPQ